MRLAIWSLRALVFLLLFGLAIMNSGRVDLRFYLEQSWQAPLSLVLLGAFAAGAAIGASVAVLAQLRQRRRIVELEQQLVERRGGGASHQ